jgi:glycosyltransferase involved in cell wall biosynthesis
VGEVADWAPAAAVAVAPGDAAALAAALTGVLADEPLRLRLAANAQERVAAWPVERTVARLLELSVR